MEFLVNFIIPCLNNQIDKKNIDIKEIINKKPNFQ